jgi:hypothetical protein
MGKHLAAGNADGSIDLFALSTLTPTANPDPDKK